MFFFNDSRNKDFDSLITQLKNFCMYYSKNCIAFNTERNTSKQNIYFMYL